MKQHIPLIISSCCLLNDMNLSIKLKCCGWNFVFQLYACVYTHFHDYDCVCAFVMFFFQFFFSIFALQFSRLTVAIYMYMEKTLSFFIYSKERMWRDSTSFYWCVSCRSNYIEQNTKWRAWKEGNLVLLLSKTSGECADGYRVGVTIRLVRIAEMAIAVMYREKRVKIYSKRQQTHSQSTSAF